MKTITALAMLLVLAGISSPSHAQSEVIQKEAERDLTEIDCQVLTLSKEADRMEQEVRAVLGKMSGDIQATQDATEEARKAARELVKDWAEDVKDLAEDTGDGTKQPASSAKGNAKGPKISKGLKVLDRLSGRYAIWVKDVTLAIKIIETQEKRLSMVGARDTLIQTSKRLDDANAQLAAAQSVVNSLLKLRKTKQEGWEARGAKLDERYFGEACGPTSMEGVWQTQYRQLNIEHDEDVIEVRGTHFYLTSGIKNVTKNCGRFEGDLSFSNQGVATGEIHHKCGGLSVFGRIELKADGSEMLLKDCMEFGYKASGCSLSQDGLPINMSKIAD